MIRNLNLVVGASLMLTGAAFAQQTAQPPGGDEPPAAIAECTPAPPPGMKSS
jgi:hypothetical protein